MSVVQALALMAVLQASEPPAGPPGAPPAVEDGWARLEVKARKGILRGHVVMTARAAALGEVEAALRPWPDGPARLPSGQVFAFETRTEATLKGTARRTALVDAQGLLQDLSEEGKRRSLRRFSATGLHRWRDRASGRSRVEESHFDWPKPTDGRPMVESASLLWLASARRLDREGARLEVAVVARGRRVLVDCVARDVVEIETGGASARRVLSRHVEIRPAEDDDEEGTISLLGMRGSVHLYLEQGTGLPVEVRGTVPRLGLVTARVVAVSR